MSDMRISTDPRVLKELLKSQFLSGIDPFQSVSSSQQDGDGLFAQLLGELTGSSSSSLDSLTGGDDWLSGLEGASDTTDVASLLLLLGMNNGAAASSANIVSAMGSGGSSAFAYDNLIQEASARYGVDPALIKGVIQSESSFRPNAESSAGAKGLMQLMDDTAHGLGVTDSFDPAQNINGGTRYLSYLLRKYDGSEAVALAAYNAGSGRVDRLGIATDGDLAAKLTELPEETQAYVRKVLQARDAWSSPL